MGHIVNMLKGLKASSSWRGQQVEVIVRDSGVHKVRFDGAMCDQSDEIPGSSATGQPEKSKRTESE